jgi:hypothetical protein
VNWAAFGELEVQLGLVVFALALAVIVLLGLVQHRVPPERQRAIVTAGRLCALASGVLAVFTLYLIFTGPT